MDPLVRATSVIILLDRDDFHAVQLRLNPLRACVCVWVFMNLLEGRIRW